MNSRVELQFLFEKLIGSRNVYFQPPPSFRMSYPAIVYSRENIENNHADNIPYIRKIAYNVVVIDKNPDSEIVKKVSLLPMCRHNSQYVSDNLYHDSFTIYY